MTRASRKNYPLLARETRTENGERGERPSRPSHLSASGRRRRRRRRRGRQALFRRLDHSEGAAHVRLISVFYRHRGRLNLMERGAEGGAVYISYI